MAWIITSTEGNRNGGEIVHKRWEQQPGEKPYKLTWRKRWPRKPAQQHAGLSARDHNKLLAVKYAKWLAKRDGIPIPPASAPHCVWDGDRIKAVMWGDLTIKIPNWDWWPAEPVRETILPDGFAAELEAELTVFALAMLPMQNAA